MAGLLFAFAGCGGSSTTTSDGNTDTSSTGGDSSSYLTQMNENVDLLLTEEGTFKEEPTTSPVRAGEDRKVAVISCGQQATACAAAAKGMEEAAQALGWKTTLFDAKLNFPSAATGIRNAVAQGVDGILMYYIDCSEVKAALQEAKNAGVPVVTSESRDCSQTDPGSPPLFTYVTEYVGGISYEEIQDGFFESAAEYAITSYEGDSRALAVIESGPKGDLALASLEAAYDQCDGCSLEAVRFPATALGTRIQGIVEQELLKNPDVNTVINNYADVTLEAYPAIRASGRSADILTGLGEGNETNMDLIRNGVSGYSLNFSGESEPWSQVDNLGRILLGDKPVPIGQGLQLIDADHNLPSSGPAKSPIDFPAMFKKAWEIE